MAILFTPGAIFLAAGTLSCRSRWLPEGKIVSRFVCSASPAKATAAALRCGVRGERCQPAGPLSRVTDGHLVVFNTSKLNRCVKFWPPRIRSDHEWKTQTQSSYSWSFPIRGGYPISRRSEAELRWLWDQHLTARANGATLRCATGTCAPRWPIRRFGPPVPADLATR